MSNKPSIPKGTRDFSPIKMARRNYIFDTIKAVYKKYGFQQIETPAMENLNTLVGTGGDESDKLIFKILNSGNYLNKANKEALAEKKIAKEQGFVKTKIAQAVENSFGRIQKLTHKDFNWANVEVWSNVIDLWEVKLKAQQTDAEKMEQANSMLAQVGLEKVA